MSGTHNERGQNGGGRRPVDSKTRAKVRKLAREGLSQSAVAKAAGVSRSTVAKLCASAQPPISFDRSKTEAAVKAHAIDLKAKRQELAQLLLDDAFTLRLTALSDRTVTIMTDEMAEKGMEPVRFEVEREGRDVQARYTALGIAVDKHLVLIRHDSEGGELSGLDRFLDHLMPGRTTDAA
jgi:transcriptional regulator with XRE-family HTH domain